MAKMFLYQWLMVNARITYYFGTISIVTLTTLLTLIYLIRKYISYHILTEAGVCLEDFNCDL